ncbi:MAG: hypothetical protein ACP5E4_04385, partial [Candidatus Aenigmatarchaeota archaeon]
TVAKGEKIELCEGAIKMIFEEAAGDLRRSTNILQASAAIDTKVTEEVVMEVIGKAKNKDLEELLSLALNKEFLKARTKLHNLTAGQGVSSDYLLKQIYQQVFKLDLPDEKKIKIIKLLADYEFRIVEGSNPTIQIEAFLARLGED